MARTPAIDKRKLVANLPVSDEGLAKDDELSMDQMSLARSLPQLANIDEEKEYQLCRALARHLLDKVPEPEEVDVE